MKKFHDFLIKESNLNKPLLDESIQNKINEHINGELYSEYLYMSAFSFFKDKNLNGLAKWTENHISEERGHAFKLINYMHDRLANVDYKQIDSPKHKQWKTAAQVFSDIFEHEKKVSEMFKETGKLVKEKDDEMTYALVQGFIVEQVEEESITQEIAFKLQEAGDNYAAILLVDKEYGG